jgi:hypothetical protein
VVEEGSDVLDGREKVLCPSYPRPTRTLSLICIRIWDMETPLAKISCSLSDSWHRELPVPRKIFQKSLKDL